MVQVNRTAGFVAVQPVTLGFIIAIVVLIIAVVLMIIGMLDYKLGLMIALLAVARLC